jgi:hypothetical protein
MIFAYSIVAAAAHSQHGDHEGEVIETRLLGQSRRGYFRGLFPFTT